MASCPSRAKQALAAPLRISADRINFVPGRAGSNARDIAALRLLSKSAQTIENTARKVRKKLQESLRVRKPKKTRGLRLVIRGLGKKWKTPPANNGAQNKKLGGNADVSANKRVMFLAICKLKKTKDRTSQSCCGLSPRREAAGWYWPREADKMVASEVKRNSKGDIYWDAEVDPLTAIWINDSSGGTRGQLVGGTVEVQVAEICRCRRLESVANAGSHAKGREN
jgi:hypothetical protein